MSFAVMTGPPTKAQLFLDSILEDLIAETKQEEDRFSLSKVIFKCLRDHPDEIRQIDGITGDIATNKQVLDKAVRTALALQAASLKHQDKVLIISRNHLDLSAAYYGCLLGGFLALSLHVGITPYELKHFIHLSEPRIIFTDEENIPTVEQTLKEINDNIPIIMLGPCDNLHHQTLSKFIAGVEDRKADAFWPNDSQVNVAAILMSTSGSTGLPKVVKLTNVGLLSQIPTLWSNEVVLPKPTKMYLCTSNAQWMTHTIAMLTTPVFSIPLLTTTGNITADHLRELFRKYRPTYTMISSTVAVHLAQQPGGEPDDLSSLDVIALTGSNLTEAAYKVVKTRTRPDTKVTSAFGMTETHGLAIMPDQDTPFNSLGKIVNMALCKIIDESGNTLGPKEPGEMCLRSNYMMFMGYLKNEKATAETFTDDGWFKTGDKVYMNEKGEIFYVERIKFMIKYQSHHVSPTELENLICGIDGVEAAAVCGVDKGPAALVKVIPGFELNAQTIHDVIRANLSDAKKLRGGIAFVNSIPLTANGKLDRRNVKIIFEAISKNKIIYDIFLNK